MSTISVTLPSLKDPSGSATKEIEEELFLKIRMNIAENEEYPSTPEGIDPTEFRRACFREFVARELPGGPKKAQGEDDGVIDTSFLDNQNKRKQKQKQQTEEADRVRHPNKPESIPANFGRPNAHTPYLIDGVYVDPRAIGHGGGRENQAEARMRGEEIRGFLRTRKEEILQVLRQSIGKDLSQAELSMIREIVNKSSRQELVAAWMDRKRTDPDGYKGIIIKHQAGLRIPHGANDRPDVFFQVLNHLANDPDLDLEYEADPLEELARRNMEASFIQDKTEYLSEEEILEDPDEIGDE